MRIIDPLYRIRAFRIASQAECLRGYMFFVETVRSTVFKGFFELCRALKGGFCARFEWGDNIFSKKVLKRVASPRGLWSNHYSC